MEDLDHVVPEIQSVIARYLDGDAAFDATARTVAEIYKRTLPTETQDDLDRQAPLQPRQIQLKPLMSAQWLTPKNASGPTIRITGVKPFSLAPGRSLDDEQKAFTVFSEALHLLFGPLVLPRSSLARDAA